MGFSGIQHLNLDPGLPRAERFVVPEQEATMPLTDVGANKKVLAKELK